MITDLETGGAERSLVNLVTGLDPTRFHNEVISLVTPGPMAEPLAAAGIPVTSLGMRRGRPTLSAFIKLVSQIRANKPDILQTWLYHADFIGTLAAVMARPRRLAWNIRCTDISREPTETSIRWLVRSLAILSWCPDAVVVNSQRGRSDHETLGYRPRSWADIPNGVDLNRFRVRWPERAALRRQLGVHGEGPVIGLVARFHPMKDVESFLRAAALFIQTQPAARFVLCGVGFDKESPALSALLAELALSDRIVCLGRRDDVENIYPALDIFTLCSIYGEGFPNVVCEAMACGVPCVVTDIGDSAAIVGDTGFVVPMRNPGALAEVWASALSRGTQALGERARQRVQQEFSLDLMRSRYAKLYGTLAGLTT